MSPGDSIDEVADVQRQTGHVELLGAREFRQHLEINEAAGRLRTRSEIRAVAKQPVDELVREPVVSGVDRCMSRKAAQLPHPGQVIGTLALAQIP